uniref:Bax inhibitor 1 n=1 Tax=Chrysotila carterae TaxID=13221 RepID=A0A7S4F383_CHRCT
MPRSAAATCARMGANINSCTAGSHAGARRCFAKGPSRFTNVKKRVEVLEKEAETPYSQQQQQQQQQQQGGWFQGSPQQSSVFPTYTDDHERRKQQQTGTQWDNLSSGVVAHMRKVYGTLAAGIGIAAGSSIFAMATPLGAVSPLIPGLAAIVPLMGLMYTNKHTHSIALRTGLFAAFTGLAGWSLAPLLKIALAVAPMAVPQALLITSGLFATMTALSMMAKPGAALRLGVPLGAGVIVLLVAGVAGMFVPVTSAWYPLLHSISLYGGLALFTAYIAYDTQRMIDDYEMGEDDHLKHAVDLFINFKAIFTRVLFLLMGRSDD